MPRCERRVYHLGHCQVHFEWKARKRYLPCCGITGCFNPIKYPMLKLCEAHYRRMRRAEKSVGQPHHRPAKWSSQDLNYAKMLLEDGASYREAARSSGVPRTTLREKLPGHGWSMAEGGYLGAAIAGNDKLKRMQKEIGFMQNGID